MFGMLGRALWRVVNSKPGRAIIGGGTATVVSLTGGDVAQNIQHIPAVVRELAPQAQPALADAEFFPVSAAQVEQLFEVVHDPADSCFEIVRDTSGWEIHGTWFDVHSIGSRHLGVTVDVNKQLPYMLSDNFKPFGNTPGQQGQGKRFTLAPGEVGTAWVEGTCGVGMTIYPGPPAQACESVNNPCPGQAVSIQNVVTTAATTGPNCPTTADAVSNMVGGGTWTVLENTNNTGWKYRGVPAVFHVPTGFSARIDWWDGHAAGSTAEGGTTPSVGEATLWLVKCNP